jgi:histidinol-phosphate aminotransferase
LATFPKPQTPAFARIAHSMSFERPNIRRMTGYTSGEQPSQADVIKLNTNENPYPATPAVAAALRNCQVEDLRRYPPPLAQEFRREAALYHGLGADNIIATNGGDELLRLVFTTFVDPGAHIAIAEPSYSLYPVLADIQNCITRTVPLLDDWRMPPDFAESIQGAKVAFIVNPHAPSGHLYPVEELAHIAAAFEGVLVIDEAYADFIDPQLQHDAVALVRRFDNVLILRTMSKGYSLAGLRFAYGIGAMSLLAPMLHKTRDSYNTDYLSQKLATAALQDRDMAALGWQKVRAERDRLAQELRSLGFSCPPSQSNFLLACVPHGDQQGDRRASAIYKGLKKRGILVRYFDQPRLRDKLRITIGTPEENSALLAKLREAMAEAN